MPTLYTAPNANLSNTNLNSVGSQYASLFGHNQSLLIQKVTRSLIYDAAPQQYFDLKLLNMKPAKTVNSDEFFYHEMGFGREPIEASAIAAGVAHPASQTVTIANVDTISLDTIIVYPNNAKGVVTNVNSGLSQITVTPMSGGSLPALAIGDLLANLSPVEADAADDIKQYFRADTIERFNFVQMFIKAQRFGKMELYKYQKAGTTGNYLTMQRQRLLQQFRIDMSNILWNGERGEVTLAGGEVAKTTGGIFPTMLQAGSANIATPIATLTAALEELALSTEFKAYGAKRFLYGTPRLIHEISTAYKSALTRYSPDAETAKLGLKGVDIGSTFIVFVPMKRFEERSCFPAAWANRLFLLDQESISCCQTWGEEMGQTLTRTGQSGSYRNYTDFWVSATFGVEFNNPLGSGWIDVI